MLVTDYDRDKRWVRTFMLDADKPDVAPKLGLEPQPTGSLQRSGHSCHARVAVNARSCKMAIGFYLTGAGAVAGRRSPIPRSFQPANAEIRTTLPQRREQLRSSGCALLSDDGKQFITRRESPTEAPNYFISSRRRQANPTLARSRTSRIRRRSCAASRNSWLLTNAPMACSVRSRFTCRRITKKARGCRQLFGPIRSSLPTPASQDR